MWLCQIIQLVAVIDEAKAKSFKSQVAPWSRCLSPVSVVLSG